MPPPRAARLPIAYGLFVAGMCAAIVSTRAPDLEQIRAVIRATAFTSAVPFLAAFTASAAHRLRPSAPTRWLVANRRWVGLSFAASHLWHLVAILALAVRSPAFRDGLGPVGLVFGGSGFVFVAAMAATSNDAAQRALGRGWGALHTAGVYLLWVDFVFTYGGAAVVSPYHAAMTLAFVAAWLCRVLAWARRRRPALVRAA